MAICTRIDKLVINCNQDEMSQNPNSQLKRLMASSKASDRWKAKRSDWHASDLNGKKIMKSEIQAVIG